jgi:hypothetical protein
MRTRWHKWWLLALLVSACGLNPQPDLPAANGGPPISSGGNGNMGAPATGGTGFNPGSGGRALIDSGQGGNDSNGVGGEDDSSAAGDHNASAGEAGAAGADQLAPGPAK